LDEDPEEPQMPEDRIVDALENLEDLKKIVDQARDKFGQT
jgi:hypothetical protein